MGEGKRRTRLPVLDKLAKATILAFGRAGQIPRHDVRGWITRGAAFRTHVSRLVLPDEPRAVRRHWAGRSLHYVLASLTSPLPLIPHCCASVRDVKTQSYTSSGGTIKLRVTLSDRFGYVIGTRHAQGRTVLRWSVRWSKIWWALTFRRVPRVAQGSRLRTGVGRRCERLMSNEVRLSACSASTIEVA